MSSESPGIGPDRSSKSGRKRVRKRRSTGENFMLLSRDRLTWRELLKTDRKFVFLVSVLLVAAFASLVMLPRIWRVSPAGFFPIFRVSGVGLLRERLAIRSAEAAEARGDLPQALENWRRAMMANPATVPSKRRFLALCVQRGTTDQDPDSTRQQVRQSSLLLRLTGTNQADLELTAAVAHAVEWEDYTVKTLGRRPLAELSPAGRATLAGAFFELDDFPAFRRVADADPGLSDPVFVLQKAAVELIMGGTPSSAGWARLESATNNAAQTLLAGHARLVAAAYLSDEPRFNQAWAVLEAAHALRPRDSVLRWQLLSHLGRTEEAASSALAFDLPARTAHEAIQVVRELDRIGLTPKAIRYGETALEQFRSEPVLWREVGRLMVRASPPEILIRFAANLRLVDWDEEQQIGIASYYLGVAEHRLGHTVRADEAFAEAAADPGLRNVPVLALECANTMRQMGYVERAERITQTIQAENANVAGFWPRVLRAARDARSESWLLDSARREYQMSPTSSRAQQQYLDALLLNRTNTSEALKLAQTLRQTLPEDPAQIVALARTQALLGQWENVQRTLQGMDESTLQSAGLPTLTRYQLVRGEALVELGRRREAAVVLAKVDATQLFPDELQRYQLLRERAR